MRRVLRPTLFSSALAASVGADADAFQDTTRVSVDSAGAESNGFGEGASITPDGRFVVFSSIAGNLVAGDTNGCEDVFVRDRQAGTTERVSVDSGGSEPNQYCFADFHQSISGDGFVVVFQSAATNLDPNDTNSRLDVFFRDRLTGTTALVSVDSAGVVGNGSSSDAAISGDGRFVCFTSDASNLVANDTNSCADVFVRDLLNGTTERVSVDSAGKEGDDRCIDPAISIDGRFVAFASISTNLVANDKNGTYDVFVRDRTAGTTERVSIDSNGTEADSGSSWPSLSADGALVAFQSSATNLVPGDANQQVDVFLRDRTLGTTTLVSVDSSGKQANRNCVAPMIDPTGRLVAFSSTSTDLVNGDTNKVDDVFVHELATGETVRRSVDSSGGQANGLSRDPAISAGGRVVAFESAADDLVASDTNFALDVFVHDLCGTPATWTNYGNGYPGTHGVPSLTAQQFPVIGSTITVDLSNSYGNPTSGYLVIGAQRANLPTFRGGEVLVLPSLVVPITFSYGSISFSGAIADDIALCGSTIDLQGIEADPGAQYGFSFSQGLELMIGS